MLDKFYFRREEQVIAFFLIIILLFLSVVLILKKEINPFIPSSFRVLNINRATKAQIETLPLIGPELSKRIIQYREKFGALRNCEEIMKVKGIGKKRFDRIKELIKVD